MTSQQFRDDIRNEKFLKNAEKGRFSKFFSYYRIKNSKKPLTKLRLRGMIWYIWVYYTLFPVRVRFKMPRVGLRRHLKSPISGRKF